MILLVGVIVGLIGGFVRAWLAKRPYILPDIQRAEVAFLAFLPQAFVFFIPQTAQLASQQWAALILPLSLAILLVFVWANRHLEGFWLLTLGLLLNFAVITANGGLMPISPETLATVHGVAVESEFVQGAINSRAFGSKDIVLLPEETRLVWLSDRFTLPAWLPIQIAYSLGDIFLAAGAFWTFWTGGAVAHQRPVARSGMHAYLLQSQHHKVRRLFRES